jgi:hypothetical protein
MGNAASAGALFQTDVAAAALHGVQAVAVAALFATSQTDRGTFWITQRVYDRLKWSVDSKHIKWLVVAFPALSTINHIVSAVRHKRLGDAAISDGYTNTFRWAEYGVSAGLMLWIIAQLSGVTDAPLLFIVAMLNIAMQFCGYMIEKTGDPHFGFTVIGWITFVAIWVPIVWKFFDSVSLASTTTTTTTTVVVNDDGTEEEVQVEEEGVDVPGVIYAIIFLQVTLMVAFGAASLYFRTRRTRKEIVSREITYASLSLAAKTLLTWLVFGGALNAGVGNQMVVGASMF